MGKKKFNNPAIESDYDFVDAFTAQTQETSVAEQATEAKTKKPAPKTVKISVQSEGDLEKFFQLAQEYKDVKKDSVQVWLDSDINYTLDAIRQSGVKIPVKHLLSAAVRMFLEAHAKEIKALLENKPKMII